MVSRKGIAILRLQYKDKDNFVISFLGSDDSATNLFRSIFIVVPSAKFFSSIKFHYLHGNMQINFKIHWGCGRRKGGREGEREREGE